MIKKNTHMQTHTDTHTLVALLYGSNSAPIVTINTHSTDARTHPCVVFVFAVILLDRKREGKKILLKPETLLHQQPLCSPSPTQEQSSSSSSSSRTRASVVSAGALWIHFEPPLPTDAAA